MLCLIANVERFSLNKIKFKENFTNYLNLLFLKTKFKAENRSLYMLTVNDAPE